MCVYVSVGDLMHFIFLVILRLLQVQLSPGDLVYPFDDLILGFPADGVSEKQKLMRLTRTMRLATYRFPSTSWVTRFCLCLTETYWTVEITRMMPARTALTSLFGA